MNNKMNHRRATMTPQSDKIAEIRDLLEQCGRQIALKKDEGGPLSWFASFDEETNLFYVDSVFTDDEALAFHQRNIGPILKGLPPLLAAPLETEIRPVFTIAN